MNKLYPCIAWGMLQCLCALWSRCKAWNLALFLLPRFPRTTAAASTSGCMKVQKTYLLSPINFFSQIPRKNCHNAMFYGIASSVFFGHIFLNAPLSHCCIMKIVYQREKLSAMFVLLFSTCTVISYMHGAN